LIETGVGEDEGAATDCNIIATHTCNMQVRPVHFLKTCIFYFAWFFCRISDKVTIQSQSNDKFAGEEP